MEIAAANFTASRRFKIKYWRVCRKGRDLIKNLIIQNNQQVFRKN